jgi:streptogramin lyase
LKRSLRVVLATLIFNPIFVLNAFGSEVTVSNFLGSGGMGSTDGASNIAQFIRPADVAVDSFGNSFVLDANGVRKIDSANRVTTIYSPKLTGSNYDYCGIAVDKDGNIWFSDCRRSTLFKISSSGSLLNSINLGSSQNSWSSLLPGVDVLPDGSVLVAIQMDGKILKVSPSGSVGIYFQSSVFGSCNTYPRPTGIVCPIGLTTSPTGDVYIVNQGSNGNEVIKIHSNQTTSKVTSPSNPIVIDFSNGSLYFTTASYLPQRIWQLYKSTDGSTPQLVFSRNDLNPWTQNGFDFIDQNNLIMTSWDNQVVRKINITSKSETIIGNAKFGGEDGELSRASTHFPTALTEDLQGNLYFLDLNGIRKISKQGVVSTIYRTPSNLMGLGYYNQRLYFLENTNLSSIDLNGSIQQIANVSITGDYAVGLANCLAVDKQGNIYIVMYRNGDYATKYIRKYEQSGTFKNLSILYSNNSDVKIALDQNDNLIVAASGQIRRFPSDNLTSGTVIGSYFGWSQNVSSNSKGEIYVYSRNENSTILNVIEASGNVENIINGLTDSSVNAGAKSGFGYTYGLLASSNGNIYLSDSNNNKIREVRYTTSGTSNTSSSSSAGNNSGNTNAGNLRIPRSNNSWSRPSGLLPGLSEVRYKGYFDNNTGFFTDAAEKTFVGSTLSSRLPIWKLTNEIGTFVSMWWGGYFIPDETGIWDFQVTSDDAAFMWIGNTAVASYRNGYTNAFISEPGVHPAESKSNSISLKANQIYPIRIQFGNSIDVASFSLEIKPPSFKSTWDTNLEGLIWHSDFSNREDCTNYGISYTLAAKLGYDVVDVKSCVNNPAKIFANGVNLDPPITPIFRGFNVTGNTLNLNLNVGTGENRPDKVYLIAPQLGIKFGDSASLGKVSGGEATWAIPITGALLGKSLKLQFISNRNGVDSDPLVRSILLPVSGNQKNKNSNVPLAASSPKYNISSTRVIVTAKIQSKTGANPISGYLIAPDIGITAENSILGRITGNLISFTFPLLPATKGQRIKTEIYLVNEIGKSKPLQLTILVPSPKQPTNVIPTQKVETVICKKGIQTRAFAGKKCPPGWNQ